MTALVVLVVAVAAVVADQAVTDSDWLSIVDRYGLPLIILGIALRWISQLYREKAELERSVREDVIPALVKSTEALARVERRLDDR